MDLNRVNNQLTSCLVLMGHMDGVAVRALTSHHCDPGLTDSWLGVM
jgi:hypothetical protein